MNKPGFTLIELLVAMAVASLIGVALFMSLLQTNRAVRIVDETVDFSSRAVLVSHQMEKDISGAFIPEEGRKKKKEAAKKTEGEQKNIQALQPEQKPQESKEEKPKQLTKIFYGVNKNDQFDQLTFITNNPVQAYWGATTGKAKPFIARVVYRLVPEKGSKTDKLSYALMRQEDYKLDIAAFNPEASESVRSYELINGIKKMTIKYTEETRKEQTEKTAKEETKTIEKTYKVLNEWNREEKKEETEKEQPSIIPYAVDIDLTLWDSRKKREKNYTFKVLIIPEAQEPEKEKQETPQQPQKEQAQQQEKKKVEAQISPVKTAANKKKSPLEEAMEEIRKFVVAENGKKAPKV